MRKPLKCPLCKGKCCFDYCTLDTDEMRREPCPLCLGTGEGDSAVETARYLRKCEVKLFGKDWPAPEDVTDPMTGEVTPQ